MKKRVSVFANGVSGGGHVLLVPKKLSELLLQATQKLSLSSCATRVFNRHGGEIDDVRLLQNDEVLFVSCGEDFCFDSRFATPRRPASPDSAAPATVVAAASPPAAWTASVASPSSPPLSPSTSKVSSPVSSRRATTLLAQQQQLKRVSYEPTAMVAASAAPPVPLAAPPSVSETAPPVVAMDQSTATVVADAAATATATGPSAAAAAPAPVIHDAWVKLNVGGRVFVTTRSTLTHSGTNMLSFMFGNDWHSSTDESGAYLIDRSPEYFAPLLNYLRCGKLHLDPGVSAVNVLEEARFFGLDELEPVLEALVRQDDPDTASYTRKAFASMLLNSNRHSQLRARGLNFEDADLSHLDMSGINFARAKFARADLTGAILDKCNLQEADLREATLCGASLRGAVMGGANLEGANLRGVNLSSDDMKTNLESANLKNTQLEDAIMTGGTFRCCNFREANLMNADLGRSDLAGANFEGANLRGANLSKTNLKGCNLRLASFDHRTGL
jgi:uncharacterized protein YjbI with pentapeptide repeats